MALGISWATDLHLNFLTEAQQRELWQQLVEGNPKAVLLGGDISEAHRIEEDLLAIEAAIPVPVYFVLGNHDYYHGTIRAVRQRLQWIVSRSPRLNWLPSAGVVELSPSTALVGHDGWGDARWGLGTASPVILNDFICVGDLVGRTGRELAKRLGSLGDETAAHFREVLPIALRRYSHVVVLTHVPPFPEACFHRDGISDDKWLPYFTCRAAGDALLEAAKAFPNARITVLCGHTHSPGVARITPNLEVRTSGSDYRAPRPELLELP